MFPLARTAAEWLRSLSGRLWNLLYAKSKTSDGADGRESVCTANRGGASMSVDPSTWKDGRPMVRDLSDETDDDDDVEEPEAVGAWPEEMDGLSVYADTSLTIPGTSDPPAKCGTWGPKQFCKTCGKPHMGPQKCEHRECRDCWRKWRLERAGAATERLAGARRAAEGAGKRLVHVVASPPNPTDAATPRSERVRTLTDWEKAKKRAYALAKEHGVRGGLLIPHGWRVREEAKQLYRELKGAGEIGDMGIWAWVRDRPEDWRTLTYWSPHFHILGLARDVEASTPEEDDGWIVKRVDSFPRFNLTDKETYRPMFRATAYLLSHAGIEPDEGKQAVRWFGSLSPGRHGISLDEELADWEQSAIERNVEDLGVPGAAEEAATCNEEGCEGSLAPVWSAGSALADPSWCEQIGRETEAELAAAFEWAIGEVMPPPGARFPSTARECEEAFELVREQR